MAVDFGGKKPQPIIALDPVVENTKELKNVEKRLGELEKSQEKFDAEMDGREKEMERDLQDFRAGIAEQKIQIEQMKKELREFIEIVMHFVKDLQRAAKTEDAEKLQRVVDCWTPESWITRNELVKITQGILEEEKERK